MIDFTSNVRPESMERITNFDLANAFIEEAVAAWTPLWWPLCSSRPSAVS